MESLDDVIDAMIADRVIHRHRRKWLLLLALVLVLALVIFFLGGWKEKTGRRVPTVSAPITLEAGRFEYGITKARIVKKPATDYSEAEATLEVSMDIRNIDEEKKETTSMSGGLVVYVPADRNLELSESNGATCRGELGYNLVYGLPAVPCTVNIKVPPAIDVTEVEIGVYAEQFKPTDSLISDQKPYWQDPVPEAVVRIPVTVETEQS